MKTSPPLTLAGLITITGALVFGLHQVGGISQYTVSWGDPVGWVASSAPEDVVAAAMRYTGLGIGYWVLATTTIYTLARLFSTDRPPRWAAVLATTAIRRIVDRALATALTASIVATPLGPAFAAEPPEPVVFEWADGIPVPHIRPAPGLIADESISIEQTSATTAPLPPALRNVATATVQSATLVETGEHVVIRGDNLWAIAATQVDAFSESTPTAAEIADYWRLVIAANLPTLRSGDPNLIYPGEIITLPAPRNDR